MELAEKHKMSLNVDAELFKKIKIMATMNNKTITEEIEAAFKKHTTGVNVDKIISK